MSTVEILSQQIAKDVQKGARVIDIQFPDNEGDPLKLTIKSIKN